MAISFQLSGELRGDNGKGASRRLRRHGKVPAILYGAGEKPVALTLDHNELLRNLEHEAFYSHILNVNIGKKTHQAILKDIQRHPAKPEVLHLDLQRVKVGEKIRMHVPLHFMNEDTAPGVKAGGVVSHHEIDIEIDCLPRDLPEFVAVDVGALEIGDSIHLSDITMPNDVVSVALEHGHDHQILSIHHARVTEEEPEEEAPEEEAAPEVEAKGKEKADDAETEDKS
ncbi:MAG TPA: 50S ribosomal protein L25/general stress protein Ctc [Gammaproteobacteria bacterium]|nr:50S ribosomal protein L25/general stress protein Ctc [Gammaproteobacteria bacterium]